MSNKTRVGVVFGGRSGEHEVSLASARSVIDALDRDRYEVIPIGITRGGEWLIGGDPDPLARLMADEDPRKGGDGEGTAVTTLVMSGNAGRESALRPEEVMDVIFPVLHGPYGEDGTIQGLLELAGLAYVGCGVLASALAMDKIASKHVYLAAGLPVASYVAASRGEWETDPAGVIEKIESELRYPVFVKPANLGSSIGVSKARDRAQVAEALTEAAKYDRRLLVEAAVPNAREIECSVLGNDEPVASVPGEIVPSNEFYDYNAKYIDGQSQLLIPAPIPAEAAARVQEMAVRAFRAVDGAGLARVDFLMDGASGDLFLNEINTLPGFTAISMYAKLWGASGVSYAQLLDRLIELALERHADKARSRTSFDGAMTSMP